MEVFSELLMSCPVYHRRARRSRTNGERQWSHFGRWADKSARPELVEGRAVGCSWFDRLTTSVGTDIGAQQTRPLPGERNRRELEETCVSFAGMHDMPSRIAALVLTALAVASCRTAGRTAGIEPALPAV